MDNEDVLKLLKLMNILQKQCELLSERMELLDQKIELALYRENFYARLKDVINGGK